MTNSKHTAAKRILANQRQMTSLIEREIISAGEDFVFDRTDWVPLYYDKGYVVTSECGTARAYRAVTTKGQLLWLVFHPNKTRGYHAIESDPVEAIQAAKDAWARRRYVRQNWAEVKSAANDLMLGRQKFEITLEDAEASPLCTLGIQGFLKGIGLPRVRRMSGRLAAMLMKVEPQMGFVIYEAMQRQRITAKVSGTLVPAR